MSLCIWRTTNKGHGPTDYRDCSVSNTHVPLWRTTGKICLWATINNFLSSSISKSPNHSIATNLQFNCDRLPKLVFQTFRRSHLQIKAYTNKTITKSIPQKFGMTICVWTWIIRKRKVRFNKFRNLKNSIFTTIIMSRLWMLVFCLEIIIKCRV